MDRDSRCRQILLIEDNPGDVGLIRRGLAQGKPLAALHVVHDGVAALAFLAHCAPDLILLDLSLPQMDGCEVLARIRRVEELAHTPVVILSSSQAEGDIVRSYAQGANCYITKPLDLEQYMAVIGSVQRFWLSCAALPRNHTHA
jgi:CheY-like chemotaxis protein